MSELSRYLAALVLVFVAGCAAVPSDLATPPEEAVVAPQVEVAATPVPTPVVVAPAKPARRDVTILFEGTVTSQAAVAAAIAAELPARSYRITAVALDDELAADRALKLRPAVIVAVGSPAVAAARAKAPGTPIVFCQVFAYEQLLEGGGPIWGVHSIPPLGLQLRSWRAIDPSLQSVALILGESHALLAADAVRAANAVEATVRTEASSSDRETLYLFKRLASDVDGLWVLPDDRVLSPDVLRELLSYAATHGVGVLAPSSSLLAWGALASVATVAADVAETVSGVVDRVAAGRTQGLPAMTPLSAVEVQVNQSVASALGLPPLPRLRWVTRDPD